MKLHWFVPLRYDSRYYSGYGDLSPHRYTWWQYLGFTWGIRKKK